jgi:hypothetical protein
MAEPNDAPRACLVFLLDRSASMGEPPEGPYATKGELVAAAVNGCLGLLTEQARGGGAEGAVDVGVIGYGTDRLARPDVAPLVPRPQPGGRLALATLGEVGRSPARSETATREVVDEFSGDIVEEPYDVPVWVEPGWSGGTPTRAALRACRLLVEAWASEHREGVPPVVVHVTDGRSRDGDPAAEAEALRGVATDRGPTLLVNCHVAARGGAGGALACPSDFGAADDPMAAMLFRMSSPWPAEFLRRASAEPHPFPLGPGSRGMVYAADARALGGFLDLVTRVTLALGR